MVSAQYRVPDQCLTLYKMPAISDLLLIFARDGMDYNITLEHMPCSVKVGIQKHAELAVDEVEGRYDVFNIESGDLRVAFRTLLILVKAVQLDNLMVLAALLRIYSKDLVTTMTERRYLVFLSSEN
jgi:hypothetical protein